MKNLSIQEKKDLDNCVFKTLGEKEPSSLLLLLKTALSKLKTFFYSK
ncbi:hypothetical protein KK587_001312 [Campylobacter coli]|nr:hypothetical protein [Campylobacter coli]